MLPVVDFGGIAIVIPHVVAVGDVKNENDTFCFDVFLTGIPEPIEVFFKESKIAEDVRAQLLGDIADYYSAQVYGPLEDDQDIDDDVMGCEDDDEGEDNH